MMKNDNSDKKSKTTHFWTVKVKVFQVLSLRDSQNSCFIFKASRRNKSFHGSIFKVQIATMRDVIKKKLEKSRKSFNKNNIKTIK